MTTPYTSVPVKLSSGISLQFPVLTGSENWREWRHLAKMFGEDKEVWSIMSGEDQGAVVLQQGPRTKQEDSEIQTQVPIRDAAWKKANILGRTVIFATVSPEWQRKFIGIDSSAECFKMLQEEYETDTFAYRFNCRRRLYNIIHDPSLPITNFIDEVTRAVSDLAAIKKAPSDEEVFDLVVGRLDSSWDTVRTIVLTSKNSKLKDLYDLLKAHNATAHTLSVSDPTPSAFAARTPSPQNRPREIPSYDWLNPSKDSSKCNRCGLLGHTAQVCMADMPAGVKDQVRSNIRKRSESAQTADEFRISTDS